MYVYILYYYINTDFPVQAESQLYTMSTMFFTMVLLCATQDVAVDGKGTRIMPCINSMRRLGSDPSFGRQSLLCLDSSNGWP